MAGTFKALLVATLAAICLVSPLAAQSQLVGPDGVQDLQAKPDRLVIRFRDSAVEAEALGLAAEQLEAHALPGWGLVRTSDIERDLKQLLKSKQLAFVSRVFVDSLGGDLFPSQDIILVMNKGQSTQPVLELLKTVPGAQLKVKNWQQIEGAYLISTSARDGSTVLKLAAEISSLPEVRFAEPDLCFTGKKSHTPNDPRLIEMWGSHLGLQLGPLYSDNDIDAPEAWDLSRGNPTIAVAVLDDGVQLNHPDMPFGMPGIDTTSESPGNYGGPVNAFDNHGTSVASLIAARMDNAFGIAGTAPETRVHAVRCYLSTTISDFTTMTSWTVAALTYCENVGVRITNNSVVLGAQPMATTLKYDQTAANGMIHYAAAGNDPLLGTRYPANLTSVRGLIGISFNGVIAPFSASGSDMDYSGPADQVITCDRSGADGYLDPQDFVYQQGTSFATAYATAIGALVLGINPLLTPNEVHDILKDSCTDLGAPGFDPTYANGLLNAFASTWRAALTRSDPEAVLFMQKSSQADSHFGSSVAVIGDVDGDGRNDFAVGAADYDGLAGIDSGRIQVYSGATGLILWACEGTTAGEGLGSSVVGLGDIDSDGLPDLAVGSPRALVGSFNNAGRVTFLAGTTGAVLSTLNGSSNDELFGQSLCSMGDLNADTLGDIAIGAPGTLVGSTQGTGRVHIISATNGATITTVDGNEMAGELSFGFSIAKTADHDMDGKSDLLIGAPKSLYGGVDSGAGIVVGSISGSRIATIPGTSSNDCFGEAVAVWGDQNGDGLEDYILSAPGFSALAGPDAGIVLVYSSQNLQPILAFFGKNSGDRYGSALASSTDLDGDSVNDLVIGIPGYDSASLTDIGKIEVWSTAGLRPRYELVGGATGQAFGRSLAALGDIDGDGKGELLVGAIGNGTQSSGFTAIFPAANPAAKGPLPLSIAAGSMGSSGSGPYDVFFVNESSGGMDRTVEVPINQDLNYAMLQPLANPNPAHFALYAYLGIPPSYLYYNLPFGIGDVLWLPCTVTPGNPIGLLVTNSTYLDPCPQLVGSFPTPWRYTHPGGLPFPLTVTFFGIIEETPATLAVTNALVLKIQ